MNTRLAPISTHRVQLLMLQALLAMLASLGADDGALFDAFLGESNSLTTTSASMVEEALPIDRAAAITSVLQSASEEWQRLHPTWLLPHV